MGDEHGYTARNKRIVCSKPTQNAGTDLNPALLSSKIKPDCYRIPKFHKRKAPLFIDPMLRIAHADHAGQKISAVCSSLSLLKKKEEIFWSEKSRLDSVLHSDSESSELSGM